MRSKFKSAPALLSILSLLLLASTASEDLPDLLEKRNFQESLDGRHHSSRKLEDVKFVLGSDPMKGSGIESSNTTLEDSFDDVPRPFEILECNLKEDLRGQLKLSNHSEWRINQTGLHNLLGNDPQGLIQCTEPGDIVVFELIGVQKFKRTLSIPHKLELVNMAPETNKSKDESKNAAIFTCPDSGPFLTIRSPQFTASGFGVQNCTREDTNSTVVIYSSSKVNFNNFKFRNNKARAIYTQQDVKLTLQNSNLANNGGEVCNGGALYASSALQLEIHDSFYERNEAQQNGGAIYFRQNCSITIVGSTFSGNIAWDGDGGGFYGYTNNTISITQSSFSGNQALRGGATFVQKHNNVKIEKSTFFKNNASFGGALCFDKNNTMTMRASNFTSNHAEKSAGVLTLSSYNNATIEEAKFANNSALGASVLLASNHNRVAIISSSLTGNQATSYGSAIYLYESSNLYMENSQLSENKGAWYGGALGANVLSDITIVNSSFTGNDARWGGGIYIESKSNVTILDSYFSKNNASQGGAVRLGMDCQMMIGHSTFEQNTAHNGGCMYMDSSDTEFRRCNFTKNKAQKFGGCFSADSSSIMATKVILSQNEAEEGGGIHVSTRTFVHIHESTISANSANRSGGGLAMTYDSRLLCVSCEFISNVANQGGGLYLQSNTKQLIVARLHSSIFAGNNASVYGGGMVVETIETKSINCSEPLAPCSKVLLFGTDFINNWAKVSGSTILATTPKNVLVDCRKEIMDASSIFVSRDILSRLQSQGIKKIDPKELCPSWHGNLLASDAPGGVIGTFGNYLVLKTVSIDGPQITGDYRSGFMLENVRSAEEFPRISVTTIDAFGNTPAPILFVEDALQLVSEDGFLKNDISFTFENMSCVISSISAKAPKGTYPIDVIPKDEDVLIPARLTISITDCGINEELQKDTKVCQDCRNGSYNFNQSKIEGCTQCPKHATCEDIFVVIENGYWQRGPCHDTIKKCIVKKACDYPNRTENITHFTQDHTNCNFTSTSLEEYGKIQCHKGYRGPLCGSCKESYGLSSNLECSKCTNAIVVALRFIAAIVYLLVGTIITIKGVIPSSSSQQDYEDVETPLLEHGSSIPDIGSSNQGKKEVENGNRDLSHPMVEGDANSMNSGPKEIDEVEVTKLKLVASWKISLNYFQVTSTAAGMDVEWTKKILDMLKGLNILGAATTDSISYSFDCLFSSASSDSKAIWRLLFCLFVPLIVISLLTLHWGYRSMKKYDGDWVYFLRRVVLTIITVTYAAYFELTQVAMRTFTCVVVHSNFDPFSIAITRYWVGDTSIECYKSTHVVLICISLVIVTLVTIGFPMFTSFTLNQHKSEVRDTSTWTHDTLGFLGGPFKQRFIYWECVTMIKKAILSVIIVFSYSLEGQAQGLLFLLVLVFFLYVHFTSYPYDEEFHSLNYYESGSLLVSCVTYTLVQFFNVERFSQEARSVISLSIIAVNVGFVCVMVYKIMKDLVHLLRAFLRSQNIYVPKNMNVISLIRVYSTKRSISQDTI